MHDRLSRIIVLLAGLAAGLHLVFLVGLGVTLQRARAVDPILLGFGLPASAQPLLLLPLIASVFSAALLGLIGWLWLKQAWALRARLFYTLSALTLVGYAIWLASLDLLPIMTLSR